MKKVIIFAVAAALFMCGCDKNENNEETGTTVSVSPDVSSNSVTSVSEEELPEIKFSAKATYYLANEGNGGSADSSGADANRVIALEDGDPLTFRPADGSGEPAVLEVGDEICGWTMDSFLMFSNDSGSFQSRFSSEERVFEGNLTIHISELTDELEAAFVPDTPADFPKASSDGRRLWFAADNLEETLEMLGFSPDDTFENEVNLRVRLKSDRIYINNLPLDDVNNLIRVNEIEKI